MASQPQDALRLYVSLLANVINEGLYEYTFTLRKLVHLRNAGMEQKRQWNASRLEPPLNPLLQTACSCKLYSITRGYHSVILCPLSKSTQQQGREPKRRLYGSSELGPQCDLSQWRAQTVALSDSGSKAIPQNIVSSACVWTEYEPKLRETT